METKLFKEYLEYFDDRKYINRNLKLPHSTKNITTVIGPRRVGKTWLLLKHAKEREREGYEVAYVNFDDPIIRSYKIRDIFDALLKEKFDYIYLDEIQTISNWELWLRRIHDLKKENIFVTGSSFSLSQDKIPSTLRGRYISYLLLPFSYKEVNNTLSLEDYLFIGGFPEVIGLKDLGEVKRKHIALVDAIFYRDVIEHYNIKNIHIAKKLLEYYLFNYSNLMSISKTTKIMKSWNINVSKKPYGNTQSILKTLFYLKM